MVEVAPAGAFSSDVLVLFSLLRRGVAVIGVAQCYNILHCALSGQRGQALINIHFIKLLHENKK